MSRLFLVLVAMSILSGSDCECRRLEALDEGMYAKPEYLPWAIVPEPELELEVEQACAWWNDEMSRDGVTRVVVHVEPGADYPEDTHGVIPVFFGYLPENEDGTDPGGLFEYAERDGRLLYGTITISADLEYHRETVGGVLRHELGNALGLSDDPNSIDLNSVMSFELAEYGELTDHDFELVADVYDNQNED